MLKVEVYLKSGHTMVIECESYEFTYNTTTLDYTGYFI
jgi:hypothetical protein